MKGGWKAQLANGRVFELRSNSKFYPPPCGLIVNMDARYNETFMEPIDACGLIGDGLYQRTHNPNIYVKGIRREQFTSRRIARRRPDLEKFTDEDLELIRYGCALDFDGRIHGHCSDQHIPCVGSAEWTVFWYPADEPDKFRYPHFNERERRLFAGAWHFDNHGGARHLGYKYGHAWATRHAGKRLERIAKLLRSKFPDLIEQTIRVTTTVKPDGSIVTATEIPDGCLPFGTGWTWVRSPDGTEWGTAGRVA